MTYAARPRTTPLRIPRILVAGLLVVIAWISASLGHHLLASSPSTAASPIEVLRGQPGGALGEPDTAPSSAASPGRVHRTEQRDRPDEADGVLPEGATIFDDRHPGVAKLDRDVLGALRQAATDAAEDGVEIFVDSGWRSPEYQELLFRQAVSEYGSEEEAARWVATANTSAHVSGDAVDIGHVAAAAWLSQHGARYGLCQIYSNEPWHYELRPEAISHRCPPMYPDPTHAR
jgi:D-alanyl-D-alanine carboxypeptidase